MSILQGMKKAAEKVTGIGRPARADLSGMLRDRRPVAYLFADDGKTPNNAKYPLLHYRDTVAFKAGLDPAAVFEELFAAHGWGRSWRNGIYDFLHFHTQSHEVLGIARGSARVQFGGAKGRTLTVEAGDVIVLPAGTGHQRIRKSDDLLVVGAYPEDGKYDQPEPRDVDHAEALKRIGRVPVPDADPVYGTDGPLRALWKAQA
ncbi:MAG: cupin domain-containing protein [Proteobacteria bacterium]|nr:cupin domain-containing protein [Pseudomonadota bacterium]